MRIADRGSSWLFPLVPLALRDPHPVMTESSPNNRRLICWGRADHGYSRNGVVRKVMQGQGWEIVDHAPGVLDALGLGSSGRLPDDAELVWVPCFRQRDMITASRIASKRGLPLIFDPLISAYDKQVFERKKFPADSPKGRKLLVWEQRMFSLADLVVADTRAHADYYRDVLKVKEDQLAVIPVGADETMFRHTAMQPIGGRRPRVVFFGSFIHLQGPEVIAEAAALCPEADWLLLGEGPMRKEAEQAVKGCGHVRFEDYPGYSLIPDHVTQADIVMGVFSNSSKAGRVIPNKLWQAMAGGRPVITREVEAGAFPWPDDPTGEQSGVITVPPRNPQALVDAVRSLIGKPETLQQLGSASRITFEQYGSFDCINRAFRDALDLVGVQPPNTD